MKKRKRSSSRNHSTVIADDETKSTTQGIRRNPFLDCRGMKENEDEDHLSEDEKEDILALVAKFLNLSGRNTQQQKINGDKKEISLDHSDSEFKDTDTLSNVIRHLLAIIREKNKINENEFDHRSFVSSEELADLLLPWAIRSLLRPRSVSINQTLEWEILHESTQFIIADNQDKEVKGLRPINLQKVLNHLTLSNLHKLVPLAGSFALSESSESSVRDMAETCYCTWVKYIYEPNFDTVCRSIIPLFNELSCSVIPTNKVSKQVLVATLELLQKAMKKANPKKAFQSLIQKQTMAILSIIYCNSKDSLTSLKTIIFKVVSDGLFHSGNNMDGFRSMQMQLPSPLDGKGQGLQSSTENQTGNGHNMSFKCYQQGLLDMIREVATQNTVEAQSIFHILPLLLDAFIQQSTTMDHSKSKASAMKKKATAKKNGQLQLLFFANLTTPAIQFLLKNRNILTESDRSVLLETIQQTVEVLLDNNVYLPSNDDDGDQNFAYLKALSKTLIDCATLSPKHDSFLKVLPILSTFLRLNHLIFHDDLSASLCTYVKISYQNEREEVPSELVDLFCEMILTYKRLRQLDYFCNSLKGAAVSIFKENHTGAMKLLQKLLHDPTVSQIFQNAVQGSPIQQIKQIMLDYNTWIEEKCTNSLKNKMISADNAIVATMVTVLCILLRSVRIDASSAAGLSSLCISLSNTSISALFGGCSSLEECNECTTQSLVLCSWTVDLSNRCDFWLRNSRAEVEGDVFDIPSEIVSFLLIAINNSMNNDLSEIALNDTVESLQLLACRRLQQLHIRIHEKQRIAFATDLEEFSITDDVIELKKYAAFALEALRWTSELTSAESRHWEIVAEALSSWAPYVEDVHMRLFLSCFCARISSNSIHCKAKWLIRDASFLETANVLKHIGPSFLENVFILLSRAVDKMTEEKRRQKLKDLLSLSCQVNYGEIDDVLEMGSVFIKKQEYAQVEFKKIIETLRALNSIQATIWGSCDDKSKCLEMCIRFEYFCRFLIRVRGMDVQETVLMMVEGRHAFSRLLREGDNAKPRKMVSPMFLSGLVEVPLRFNTCTIPEILKTRFFDSTKNLVLEVFRYVMSTPDQATFSRVIQNMYETEVEDDLSDDHLKMSMVIGRCVMSILSHNVENDIGMLQQKILERCFESANSLLFDAQEGNTGTRQCACLFVSEYLLKVDLNLSQDRERLEQIKSELLASFTNLESATDDYQHFISYIFACFVKAAPMETSKEVMLAFTEKAMDKQPTLVQDALCDVAMQLDAGDLSQCLANVLNNHARFSDVAQRLRLFRLVVLKASSEEQIATIGAVSRPIFSMALSALTIDEPAINTRSNAVDLIQALSARRDIISIRERELGVIFASTVIALNTQNSDARAVSSETFDACFSMVSFVLQRFSKQLHNCIASVITCLGVLLRRCLTDDLSDLEIVDRGHKFSRLCELLLPHGEIYKKHVLCLLVAFVEGLKHDMKPLRRSSLSPAMYCLLDIIQQHETMQLNSMLDGMGRAMLRTVHENYRKQHVYKGQ